MEGTMNAVHCVGREEPWQYVEDAPIPQIKDDEVLLEIKACGICGKDMQANTVTVGPESALFDRIVYAEDVNWIAIPELKEPLRVTARTRYHQTEQAATVYPAENGFRLEFNQPQRAPTPGQSVVLYQGDVVLGGGIITRVEK